MRRLARRTQVTALVVTAIFVVGVLTRLAAMQYLDVSSRYSYDETGYLTFDGRRGDDREYEGRGWNLVSGGDFWALPSGDGNAPPGFPFLIAVIYAITGRHLIVLLLLNAVAGAVTGVLTYYLARKITDGSGAIAAGLVVAVDPLLVFAATRVLAETITVFLAVAMLLLATRLHRREPEFRRAIVLGLVMAAAILTRNQLVAFGGAIGVWLLAQVVSGRTRKTAAAAALVVCSVSVASITLLAARNGPAGTHQAQQMITDGYLSARAYVDVRLDRAAHESRGRLSLDERAEIVEAAEAYIEATPAWRVLAFTWYERFRIFWQLEPTVGNALERFIYTASTAVLFSLSAAGVLLWVLHAQRTGQAASYGTLLLLTVLAVTALHVLVHAKPRYRLPLHPVLAIWAVFALRHFGERLVRIVRNYRMTRRGERIAT